MSSGPQRPPIMSGQRNGSITHPPAYLQHGDPTPYQRSEVYQPGSHSDFRPSYDIHPHQSSQLHYPLGSVPPPPNPRRGSAASKQAVGNYNSTEPKTAKTGKKRGRPVETASPPKITEPPVNVNLPSVLVREKKQKACANCRRAKLKCIVEEGKTDCVRCEARKEKCVFYPRSHDEDWQQTLTQDVYQAIGHLSQLSSAVHHILFHLTSRGMIPPFINPEGGNLDEYCPPERDVTELQGWSAEKNADMPPPPVRRRKGQKADGPVEPRQGTHSREHSETINSMAGSSMHSQGQEILPGRFPADMWPQSAHTVRQLSDIPQPGPLSFQQQTIDPSITMAPHTLNNPPFISDFEQSSLSVSGPPVSEQQNITPNNHPPSAAQPAFHPPQIEFPDIHPPLLEESRNEHPNDDPIWQPTDPMGIVSPGILLGQADPRADVITMGMVKPADAIDLVNYTHQKLGPFLFGYALKFGQFPYLNTGPRHITPLILAVLCLFASERLPEMFHYFPKVADATRTHLLGHPAGSWIPVDTTKPAEDDYLDPEVAIGPEEIVACALLSLWTSEQEDAANLARVAFSWARAWIKIISEPGPRSVVVEIVGMVPRERTAEPEDKARVWLLCYLTDGIAHLEEIATADTIRDPDAYCQTLVTDPHIALTGFLGKSDIILTSHARLLHLYRCWNMRSNEIIYRLAGDPKNTAKELQRLASETDVAINNLRHVMQLVPEGWVSAKEFDLFGLFVKTSIYSRLISQESLPNRQRAVHVAHTVNVGLEMLEKCSSWDPPEEITNLPQQYLLMITIIARTVTENIAGAAQSSTPTGCSVTPQEVYPLLEQLAEVLSTGPLKPQHNARICATSCTRLAGQLRAVCR